MIALPPTMVVMSNASLNVALPTLARDLNAGSSGLQWIVDAYSLVFAGLLLTAGSLGDRYGRRLALNGGLIVFGAASLFAVMSSSSSAVIAARAVMHTRYGVTPDLITVGKVIGGGLPIGAVGGSSEVMSVFDPIKADGVTWGGTFSGNPMSMVAGLAALREYGQPEIAELNRLGDDLRVRLREAGLDVSGSGSLLRLLEPVGSTEFWWHLYSAGVLACTNGLLSLSTPMGEPEIDRIGDAIIDVIRSRTTRV